MIKNIKKILIAILIICVSLILPNNVYAGPGGGGSGKTPPGSTGHTGPPSGPGSLSCDSSSGWTATCSTTESWYNYYQIFAHMWDMNGNYIGDTYGFEENLGKLGLNGILAGTYVKLQIYEVKETWIQKNVSSTGIQEYHDCVQHVQRTCEREKTLEDGTTKKEKYDCSYDKPMPGVKGTSCPSGYESTKTYYKYTDSCNSARLQCRNSNPPAMPAVNPSFTLNLSDSNDVKSSALALQPIEGKEVSSSIIDEKGNWYWRKGANKTFSYSIEKTCINVKTGKINYIKKTEECDKNKEYEIASEDGKWTYFIPLNANSKEDFSLSLKEIIGSGKIDSVSCEDIMKNYPNDYRNFLKSAGEEFSGVYEKDKKKVSKGCYWALNIIIPITQKFYNEQDNGTFKGFNFYYKPIDINNPFPNGIPTNSIWTEKETKKLTGTSFNKDDITYIADVTNANAIRDYKNQETNHKKNLYTSWENMHINGVSDFIENGGFIKRNVSKTDFYKLGCGPENEKRTNSDGTTNYLYQQECGTR